MCKSFVSNLLCGKRRGRLLSPRSVFGAGFELEKRAEEMWKELRRYEKRREEMRRHKMSWHKLRRVEKSCEKSEKSSGDMRRDENSCDQLRGAERGREDMRWDEMRWGAKTEKTWVELRWDAMTPTAVTVGCNEQFSREAATRWDHMKWEKVRHSKTWHQIDKSRVCCCEARGACLSPIGTAFVPLYRL